MAADVSQQTNDAGQLEPMLRAAARELQDAGVGEPIRGGARRRRLLELAADHRAARGRHPDDRADQGRRPDSAADAVSPPRPRSRAHRPVARHPHGAALYRRRQQIIEPVFAHTKFLRRIDRFNAADPPRKAEWQLIAAGHNLLKLWRATTPAAA
ncbi:MAG: hypothetical protein R2736_12540 [Solirubrobacterales bacterium]